jgi:serine/threonine protein kinase/ankyrin repeat protein
VVCHHEVEENKDVSGHSESAKDGTTKHSKCANSKTTDSKVTTQRTSELAYIRSKLASLSGSSQGSGFRRSQYAVHMASLGVKPGYQDLLDLDHPVASLSSNLSSSRTTQKSIAHHCKECVSHDTNVFPFVSDVAPMAILMILEAVQNHKELSFSPMKPAYTHERPEYLNNGFSFQVTRVPWQQVRVDTAGRIVGDAVYKRLNRTASKSAWIELLKDVVVTHHMTYHVSDMHKRNVVQLLGLGWERTVDDSSGQPTLMPVIALEYASYGTLRDLYYSSAFLSSYDQQIRLLTDIAQGLQALHCSGIIHGDVKPENILICKDPEYGFVAKLTDFGFSIIDDESGPASQRLPGHTPVYSAPEVENAIPRARLKYTDVYSFGIVVWQTFLGGTLPFFSQRYANGVFLTLEDIARLKTGRHNDLAEAYDFALDQEAFWKLNRCEELQMSPYVAPRDHVNDLLVAMAQDNLSMPKMNSGIPKEELRIILSVLQICLSSCPIHRRLGEILLLLGQPYRVRQIVISRIVWKDKVQMALQRNLRYQTVTARAREFYSDIFEQFFATLQKEPKHGDCDKLSEWDRALARHLGSSLVEYYMWKYMAGDHSAETKRAILNYLALCSSAGDLDMCAAGLGTHQFLGAKMHFSEMYSRGNALALLRGDNCLWNMNQPSCKDFEAQLTKGVIIRSQAECMDQEQLRIAAHVLMGQNVGPFNVNYRNSEGNTLLNLACQSGNFPLAHQLIEDHGASATIPNNYGEQPLHWLHQIPSTKPEVVYAITVTLKKAGSLVDAAARPRLAGYVMSSSNIHVYPTPLLRAIARRNYSAAVSLIDQGAKISLSQSEIYTELNTSPMSLACGMLEYEILDVMLSSWETNVDLRDPNNEQINGLWDEAIGGFRVMDRVKLHGHSLEERIQLTLAILTKHLGFGWIVRNTQSSLLYAVEGGDLIWVEALLKCLFSVPSKAVLADLQKGLECAVAQGHYHITKKLLEYGALPLLPRSWAYNDSTAGRPGIWSERLIDSLTSEMMEKGQISANTRCALHACAAGGEMAVTIAREIVQRPVMSDRLQPALADANKHGLKHFVRNIIEGGYPKLDRPDEDHHTPLYEALAFSEFKVAQYFIDQGASHLVDSWSLHAQLFEDGRTSLPHQIEFLLRNPKNSQLFKIKRRVFTPFSNAPMHDFPHIDEGADRNWHLETHTIITAAVDAARALNTTNKKRVLDAILSVYNSPQQLLEKCGDGRDALQMAIDNVDVVTLRALTEVLKKHPTVWKSYTLLDRVRKLLLSETPKNIACAPAKRRIIVYRCNLGKMIEILSEAGDQGTVRTHPSLKIEQRIFANIKNEFPILLLDVVQRGTTEQSMARFRDDAATFLNTFMMALDTSSVSVVSFQKNLEVIKSTFTKLLGAYVDLNFEIKGTPSAPTARVKLSPKKIAPPQQAAKAGSSARTGTAGLSSPPPTSSSTCKPLIPYPVYRGLVVRMLSKSATPDLLSNHLSAMELSRWRSEDLTNPDWAIALDPALFIATILSSSFPNRIINMKERKYVRTPAYYYNTAHSTLGTKLSDYAMEAQTNKANYFQNVVQRINPQATNFPRENIAKKMSSAIFAHAENVAETHAFSEIEPWELHPLFGKMRINTNGRNMYVDLPMQTYTEGMKRMARRMLGEGMQFPPELRKRLDELDK